ncbi:DegV family protein [Convivina intestini]|uniref:DegV family protein with EDD domain n=1 Tax=Convivina intestini TaxID=1505726 RepID=A0A2U1DET1_9LACO|nr:DegV family protein [Convivina intestini]PVY86196.1 DegV family protein with EDD domain [Convivina intestini]CAH1851375.1 DegV domain-containing protein [Convivina intestini]CAH1852812.1 DegV domain-containing protein [Convivina intestini]SDB81412.1 EDD domain protein, DegV family [Leuconostocaceae bacterium R-53105]
MVKVAIVTDSAARLTAEEIKEYDIHIVPLTVQIDGTVYEDGVTIHPEEFLEKMAQSSTLPQTSQPSIGAFKETYDKIYQEHPEAEILSLHLSSGLSGTVGAAQQAGSLTKADVTTFDTLLADRSEGFVVLAAAKAAKAGEDMDTVVAAATTARSESHIYLSFRSLTNMVAGGRLSKTQGLIGNLLNIKVGAFVDAQGKVDVMLKGRGMKTIAKFNDEVIEKMKGYTEMLEIGISHAGVAEEAQALADRLNQIWPDINILISTTTPIVSTHTGLGALAILYRAR